MSVKLCLNTLPDATNQHIYQTLTINCGNEYVDVFDVVKEPTGSSVIVPFSFARSMVPTPELSLPVKHISNSSATDFVGKLRPEQQKVRNDAIESLNEKGSVIISSEPGFGKTITSIEMICTINLPTVIFVKQKMIMDQWESAIHKYAPFKKVSKITSDGKLDLNSNIYIINPIVLKKPIHETRFAVSDFEHIKLVVVDELHQIVSKVLHKAFFKFQPFYILGLSATPYRPQMDPFKPVVSWFFGTNIVGTTLFRKHKVYYIKTNFKPITRIQPHTGKLDWSSVLTSQAQDTKRNNTIVDVVRKFPERTWIILVKRVEHAKALQTIFKEKGIDSETIIGSSHEFDKSCKILIGTMSKVGVGFDHPPIDALCMAADVLEYFEQFLGRCMRRQDVEPVVIDFEDNFRPLIKHLNVRIQKYKKHGGVVTPFSEDSMIEAQPKIETKEPQPTIKLPTRKTNKISLEN